MAYGPLQHGLLRGRTNFIIWCCEIMKYFEAINLRDTFIDHRVSKNKVLLAMELMRFYMNKSERAIIADCFLPSQALRLLCSTYYPNTLVNHALIRSEIAKIVHGGVGKTQEFVRKIARYFCELRYSGAIINDAEMMSTMMFKLSAEFAYLIPVLNQCRTAAAFCNIIILADDEMGWAQAMNENKRQERDYKQYNRLV